MEKLSQLLNNSNLDQFTRLLMWKSFSKILLNEYRLLEYEECVKELMKMFPQNVETMWMMLDLYFNPKYLLQLEKQTKSKVVTQQSYKKLMFDRYSQSLEMIDSISNELKTFSGKLEKKELTEWRLKLKEY